MNKRRLGLVPATNAAPISGKETAKPGSSPNTNPAPFNGQLGKLGPLDLLLADLYPDATLVAQPFVFRGHDVEQRAQRDRGQVRIVYFGRRRRVS